MVLAGSLQGVDDGFLPAISLTITYPEQPPDSDTPNSRGGLGL